MRAEPVVDVLAALVAVVVDGAELSPLASDTRRSGGRAANAALDDVAGADVVVVDVVAAVVDEVDAVVAVVVVVVAVVDVDVVAFDVSSETE